MPWMKTCPCLKGAQVLGCWRLKAFLTNRVQSGSTRDSRHGPFPYRLRRCMVPQDHRGLMLSPQPKHLLVITSAQWVGTTYMLELHSNGLGLNGQMILGRPCGMPSKVPCNVLISWLTLQHSMKVNLQSVPCCGQYMLSAFQTNCSVREERYEGFTCLSRG